MSNFLSGYMSGFPDLSLHGVAPLFHVDATGSCMGRFVFTVGSGPEPGIAESDHLEPLGSPGLAGLGRLRRLAAGVVPGLREYGECW